jgi:hypothetical protein
MRSLLLVASAAAILSLSVPASAQVAVPRANLSAETNQGTLTVQYRRQNLPTVYRSFRRADPSIRNYLRHDPPNNAD